MTRLLVVGGVIGVLLIAAGIIGFGWYQTQIKPLGKTVLQVGNAKYSLGALERRMKVMKNEGSYYTQSNTIAAQLADDAMTQLEQEEKLLQGASALHISISDEEFATEIKDRGNVSADAKPDVYAASFRGQVKDSGLKEGEFRSKVEADLLEKKILDYFKFVAKPSEPEIKANYLVADTQEKADQVLARVRAGEDFKTVATDVVGGQTNGSLDWTPRGGSAFLPDEVENFLFDAAQVNQFSDAISVSGVFYVVQLLDKDPNRALDDTTRQQVAARDASKWVDDLSITVKKNLSDDDRNKALDDVY